MAMTVTILRYFPMTIFHTGTGAVKSSWSVLFFFSSARILMVRTGVMIRNRKVTELNVKPKSGLAYCILYAVK